MVDWDLTLPKQQLGADVIKSAALSVGEESFVGNVSCQRYPSAVDNNFQCNYGKNDEIGRKTGKLEGSKKGDS